MPPEADAGAARISIVSLEAQDGSSRGGQLWKPGTFTSSRTVAMFDCGKKTVAVKENIFFHDEKTNKVFDRSAAGKPGYGPAIKGTLPDIAMTYLCK